MLMIKTSIQNRIAKMRSARLERYIRDQRTRHRGEISAWSGQLYATLHRLDQHARTLQTVEEGERVYSFFVDALGRELAGCYQYFGMSEHGTDLLALCKLPWDVEKTLKTTSDVISASDAHIVYLPWDVSRLRQSLADVAGAGYQRPGPGDVCTGVYYPELRFCAVENAHHHTAAEYFGLSAAVPIKVQRVSLKGAFGQLHTDGHFCWKSETFPGIPKEMVDPRFAAMYEIARRREMYVRSFCPAQG